MEEINERQKYLEDIEHLNEPDMKQKIKKQIIGKLKFKLFKLM